jgi:acetyl esterase/lipase
VALQLLNQPGLDDRQQAWSARHFTDTPFVTREKIAQTWEHCLGSTPASAYLASAQATDLSELPGACIAAAEFCPNRDEHIDYALRLLQAGKLRTRRSPAPRPRRVRCYALVPGRRRRVADAATFSG